VTLDPTPIEPYDPDYLDAVPIVLAAREAKAWVKIANEHLARETYWRERAELAERELARANSKIEKLRKRLDGLLSRVSSALKGL